MSPRTKRTLAVLSISGLLLAACGDEPADRNAFVRAMEGQGEMTPEQAECMAVAVFDEGGLTEAQINEGSDNPFDGGGAFLTVFEAALDECT